MFRVIAFLVALALLAVRFADGIAHEQLDAQAQAATAVVVLLQDIDARQTSSSDIFHARAHCASQMADHLLRVQPVMPVDFARLSEKLPLPTVLAQQGRDPGPPIRPPLA